MDDLQILHTYLDVTNDFNKAILKFLEALVNRGYSKHGELTVAKALIGGEKMKMLVFKTNSPNERIANQQLNYFATAQKLFSDENNGVGQICYTAMQNADGSSAILYREEEADRVRSLSRDFMDVEVVDLDINSVEIPQSFLDQFRKREKDLNKSNQRSNNAQER